MKPAILACMAVLLMCSLRAQRSTNSAPAGWPQEPSSFVGIKLGAPLSASLPECPWDTYGWVNFGKPCFKSIDSHIEVHNVENFSEILVEEVDGKVGSVACFFPADTGNTVLRAMIAKFGLPHRRWTEQKTNSFGAVFNGQISLWEGRKTYIEFSSLTDEVDKGSVIVSTSAYYAYVQKQENQKKKSLEGTF